MPRKAIDMSGERYGKLVVLTQAGIQNKQMMWNCICDCGVRFVASGNSIRRGKTLSCGCVYKQSRPEIARKSIAKVKHGDSFERLYFVWNDIKSRCNNPNDISYKHYGARGIKVCEEWEKDYTAFKSWAILNGYNKNAKRGECSIDRIDVNGNYSPENCRWISSKEQCNNKTNTIFIEIGGIRKTTSEWAELTGLRRDLIYSRYKRGWKGEEIISKPDQHRARKRES